MLFDITNRRSFQNVHNWLEEAQSHVQPHNIVFLLVGHKCDLEAQRQVTQHEAEKLAGAYGMRYVETSARESINVEKVWTGRCSSFPDARSAVLLLSFIMLPWKLLRLLHDPNPFLLLFLKAFVDLTKDIFELVRSGDITIQDGWEGVKSGLVPNTVHSSEEVTKGSRQCFC